MFKTLIEILQNVLMAFNIPENNFKIFSFTNCF